MKDEKITQAYQIAKEQYAAQGVDVDAAMKELAKIPISLHCWQGDDVGGFERPGATLDGGGIQATGNYPGKARTIAELRADLDQALKLVPGRHRLNLHASYADLGGRTVERNALTAAHFASWVEWCRARGLGIDFNPTFFSHPLAADGFTLSHPDAGIRRFWIEHGIACRRIAAEMGRLLTDTAEIDRILADAENTGNPGLTDEDDVPEPPEDATTQPGDLWILGGHRLLCADSSDPAAVDRLVNGSAIHLVNMDPPYNVKVEPRSNNAIAAGLSSFTAQATTHHQALDLARHPEKAKGTTKKMRAKDRPLLNDFVSEDEDTGSTTNSALKAQNLNSDGTPHLLDYVLNITTTDKQTVPRVAGFPTGSSYVVVWQSNLQDGSGNGVIGRLFR